MIIDEEQRFGVKDKEKLKEMKHNVDCLTMSELQFQERCT
jgi:transcription-repair coupling factor (superfamily II helicase)